MRVLRDAAGGGAPPRETRKTVTIVFSDLKGSTNLGEALDSESLREVMTRYFEEMRAILEEHGGRVEKYIGDAIMAVFGLPRIHEEDALRAVRAAKAMQDALATLNEELYERWGVRLENRTGVNTGEVVAGDPSSGQRLVIGDAVNTAARLEQAAPTLEILVGESTYRLVRHAVDVEAVEPLALKGKAEPVPAYRLLAVHEAEGIARRHDRPLVGREQELAQLEAEFGLAAAAKSCRLVTLIADAGVGKSRLIEEFGQAVGDRGRVVSGRCLPYGRGHTYWPLVEIFRKVADDRRRRLARPGGREDRGRGRRPGRGRPGGVRDRPHADAVRARGALLGRAQGARDACRRDAARRRLRGHPLGRDDLVDLIEHLLRAVKDVPLVVLCAARHDFLELRPEWPEHGAILTLEPLSEDDSVRVIRERPRRRPRARRQRPDRRRRPRATRCTSSSCSRC